LTRVAVVVMLIIEPGDAAIEPHTGVELMLGPAGKIKQSKSM
jgi:hypothetical protein